jgi:hypothetical protein
VSGCGEDYLQFFEEAQSLLVQLRLNLCYSNRYDRLGLMNVIHQRQAERERERD